MLLVLLLVSFVARAQYADTDAGVLKRSGTHLKMDGVKLSREAQAALLADIDGIDYNKAWNKAKSGRNAGVWLIIGGHVVAIGGVSLATLGVTASLYGALIGAMVGAIVGGEETAQQAADAGATAGDGYIKAGLITGGVGLAAVAAGIPMVIVNSKKLNGIVDDYNAGGPGAQVSLGPTTNGFGLSVRF